MFTIKRSDLDYSFSNYSIDMTILGLFVAVKRLFPVEIARNIVADIINHYMNKPTVFFNILEIDEEICVDIPIFESIDS